MPVEAVPTLAFMTLRVNSTVRDQRCRCNRALSESPGDCHSLLTEGTLSACFRGRILQSESVVALAGHFKAEDRK